MCTTPRRGHKSLNEAKPPTRSRLTRIEPEEQKQNGLLDSQVILSFEAASQEPPVKKSKLSAKTDSNARN